MSSLDGQDLFGSGPHAVRSTSWQRSVQRRGFAGLDGELILDMGLRSRIISQTGRLQAGTADALNALVTQIEEFLDGRLHTLVDDHGRSFPNVLVEEFEPTTPLQRGRNFWCEYVLRYRQLP